MADRVRVGGAFALVVVVLAALFLWWPREPATPVPTPPPPSPSATAPLRATMDVGRQHACRVEPDGAVTCWGANFRGQLGIGVRSVGNTRPVEVVGIDAPVATLSAGDSHTCAVTTAGDVLCWGANDAGQLGDGTTEASGIPVAVRGLGSPAVAVSAGGAHTCVVTRAGGVACWGDDQSGQLGGGRSFPTGSSSAPVDVVDLATGVVSVSAGVSHTCAVTTAGGVKCWGDNYLGQLGDGGDRSWRNSPADVVGLASGMTAVAAGVSHTCALTAAGRVTCWGANTDGQLGDGTVEDAGGSDDAPAPQDPPGRNVPGDVLGLTAGVTAISAYLHSCAVTAEGRVACWGPNYSGQLGGGTGSHPTVGGVVGAEPVDVVGLPAGASVVSTGLSHSCLATDEGAVTCWGSNEAGELGDGTTLPRLRPVPVADVITRSVATRAVQVNVIMVDSSLEVTRDAPEPMQEPAEALAQRLAAQDPTLMRQIGEAFRAATWGAFDPTVQVVTARSRLELPRSRCLDRSLQGHLLEAAARPHRVEGAINLVLVKALICSQPDESEIIGYDGYDAMPVVGWASLEDWAGLTNTMIHEYGHDVGLLHAGLAECRDPVALTGCVTDETGDPASVMSYVKNSDAFTAAELHQLGLDAEGEVVVSDRELPTEEFRIGPGGPTASALLLEDQGVYISGEPGRLEVRFYKSPEQKSSHGVRKSQASLAVVEWPQPKTDTRIYKDKTATVTYLGTDAEGNVILRVTRPHLATPTPHAASATAAAPGG